MSQVNINDKLLLNILSKRITSGNKKNKYIKKLINSKYYFHLSKMIRGKLSKFIFEKKIKHIYIYHNIKF